MSIDSGPIQPPVRVAEPVYAHGTAGAFRVVDASNRVICEVGRDRRSVADEITAALNKPQA